ncbi:MAG: transposase [Atopobiaceae bacterium]
MTKHRHLGMKCHAATDAGAGYVVAETYTAVNVSDVTEAAGLVREDDEVVYADARYRSIGKRPEVASDPISRRWSSGSPPCPQSCA